MKPLNSHKIQIKLRSKFLKAGGGGLRLFKEMGKRT